MSGERRPLAVRLPRSDLEAASGQLPPVTSGHFQLDGGVGTTYERGSWWDTCWHASSTGLKVVIGGALAAALVLVIVVGVLAGRPTGGTHAPHWEGSGRTPLVTFLAVGDWGRQGQQNQSEVAAVMGDVAKRLQSEFVVSVGDNFYPSGLNGTDDPIFTQTFTDVYTAASLDVPWHAVLGNHDYGDGSPSCLDAQLEDENAPPCLRSPAHELSAEVANRDPRWHCERTFVQSLADGRVDLFFMDTSPFIERYQNAPFARYPGGILQQSWEAQLRELESHLAASAAQWKLIVGHHPPRSNGKHGNNEELIVQLEPLIQKYGVQAFFAGHDHNLEHLTPSQPPYHVFVTGAGSATDRAFIGHDSTRWQYMYSGFLSAAVHNDAMAVDYYTLESGAAKPAYSTLVPLRPQAEDIEIP